jgi:hypothetical protein
MVQHRGGLRKENSQGNSGVILNEHKIEILREEHYIVKEIGLSGDAPKQFIHAYFYTKDSKVKKGFSSSWIKYISKTAAKWYPHEPLIEYMINRVGQELNLPMNEVKLVFANGQLRFLSKYFLNKDQKLIHGAEICGQHLGDMNLADEIANNRKTSRELFTFEFISDAIKSVFPETAEILTSKFVEMIVFDAIVGNNDRHFYNWGVIHTIRKSKALPNFAPIYDSSRGLLWNHTDDRIVKDYINESSKFKNYLESACPRVSIEADKGINHFQLVSFIFDNFASYRDTITNLITEDNEKKVLKMIDSEFQTFFVPDRLMITKLILKKRFEKLRDITS